jgi:hypothetical protein
MNGEDLRPANRAERLALAGAVAPRVRSQSDRAAMRRVARVNAEGKIVGYTTLAEVQKALLERERIEMETVDGVRPKGKICEQCGKPTRVGGSGKLPSICRDCRRRPCVDCGKRLSQGATYAALKEKREMLCLLCTRRRKRKPPSKCVDCGKALGQRRSKRCALCNRAHGPKGAAMKGSRHKRKRRTAQAKGSKP